MPHASLTPLGGQLRSVLFSLRPAPPVCALSRRCPELPSSTAVHTTAFQTPLTRSYHASQEKRSAAAVATAMGLPEETVEQEHSVTQTTYVPPREYPRQLSRRRLSRRTRVDHVTDTLRAIGRNDVAAPAAISKRLDLSHTNPSSRHGRAMYLANARRYNRDFIPISPQPPEVRLESLLGNCIRHRASGAQTGEADCEKSMQIQPADAALLARKGYSHDNVRAWADIILSPDSLQAAERLAKCTTEHGVGAVPVFVLSYLLRRPYLKAGALRIIIQQCWSILEHPTDSGRVGKLHPSTIFIIYQRLLRHAREVWPAALESLPDILLRYLPRAMSNARNRPTTQLQPLTYMLNKAMRLIANPTAFEPFKNNRFQEGGIIRILQYMTEHDPPLQINRQGYRAVILLQLAQRKRPKEQEWAELKALSWPPWKEERTAMDADITFHEHGISKAAETLERMREAGYGHLAWEKVASIYTGWDTDRTPTIQTLVLLAFSKVKYFTILSQWAARIATTRTAQEAWACFLAYENKKLPPSQEVYLAIFQKLHMEQKRQRESGMPGRHNLEDGRRPLFSGDVQEVDPLPPSIHLYTYTRTSPPTMHGLYRQLHNSGVVFEGHCLAFLIANANTLKMGVEYFLNSADRYPQAHALLRQTDADDLTQLPMPIFTAFVELLSRFSNVPFPQGLIKAPFKTQLHPVMQQLLDRIDFNGHHCLVRAVELLAWRDCSHRPAWNAVLRSLTKEVTFQNISPPNRDRKSTEQASAQGALVAYRIMRRVLALMRQKFLDLDAVGFQAYCLGLENASLACWRGLRGDHERRACSGNETTSEAGIDPHLVRITDMLLLDEPTKGLKSAFYTLVGHDSATLLEKGTAQPHILLLEMPSPAVLHSYIRALGWMADYHGILHTVRWMSTHREDMLRRREQDRNGDAMTRRVIVAVKAFLERSWLGKRQQEHSSIEDELTEQSRIVRRSIASLKALETPAAKDVVDEVRNYIEEVDEWGGWPDDAEVEEYCTERRFLSFL